MLLQRGTSAFPNIGRLACPYNSFLEKMAGLSNWKYGPFSILVVLCRIFGIQTATWEILLRRRCWDKVLLYDKERPRPQTQWVFRKCRCWPKVGQRWPQVSSKSAQTRPKVCPKASQSRRKVCPKFVKSLPKPFLSRTIEVNQCRPRLPSDSASKPRTLAHLSVCRKAAHAWARSGVGSDYENDREGLQTTPDCQSGRMSWTSRVHRFCSGSKIGCH